MSTCSLADEIAKVVIQKFRSITRCDEMLNIKQVLAGIVAVRPHVGLSIISIGVGNKFHPKGLKSDHALRDCHAEILARRAFKLFLLRQLQILIDGGESDFFEMNEYGKIVVKDDIQFALYISSCPCGNACIRRWGDSPKESMQTNLGPYEFPKESRHPNFHAHARHEGQLAVTCKGISSTLSCSDKILGWNVKGIQGTRLSSILEEPLMLKAVVVGRKFVKKHAERAFCCRLTAKGINKEVVRALNHPLMMCTSAKLDESAFTNLIEDGNDAVFGSEAMWWMDGFDACETLNGETGTLLQGGSHFQLSRKHFNALIDTLGVAPPSNDQFNLAIILETELNKLRQI